MLYGENTQVFKCGILLISIDNLMYNCTTEHLNTIHCILVSIDELFLLPPSPLCSLSYCNYILCSSSLRRSNLSHYFTWYNDLVSSILLQMIAFHSCVNKYILYEHIYYLFFTHSLVDSVNHFLGPVTGDAYERESRDASLW